MKLSIFFFSFIRIRTNQIMSNEISNIIMNKIINREYSIYIPKKPITKVTIRFIESEKMIHLDIEQNLSDDSKKITRNFMFLYEDKSLIDITEDIEVYLGSMLKFPIEESVNLIYDSITIKNCSFFKDVIENISNINQERRENKNGWEIYYDNICDNNSYLAEVLNEIKNGIDIKGRDFSAIAARIYYILENNGLFVRFRMSIENVHYLFELDVKDFDMDKFQYLKNFNINLKNKFDEEIFKKLLVFYKTHDVNLLDTYSVPRQLKCTPRIIEIEYPYLKIELHSHSLSINDGSIEHLYCIKDDSKQYGSKTYIENQCFSKLQEVLENIKAIKNNDSGKGVEMFFGLLVKNKKIDFLVMRIFKPPRSALKLIFAHLLMYGKLIKSYSFHTLIGKRQNNEKEQMIENVIYIISTISPVTRRLEFFLIKICLLIEAENFINENDVIDCPLFITLKEIGNFIDTKNNTNGATMKSKRENIRIAKIIQEVVNIQIDNIINYKIEFIKHVCKITSLFIGLSKYKSRYDEISLTKDEIIESLGLDKIEISKCSKGISKKLFENNREDKIFEKRRKIKEIRTLKITKILQKTSLKQLLNEKLMNALIKNVENIFDENVRLEFENALIKEGIKIIEYIFEKHVFKKETTYIKKIFALNNNEKLVNDYKRKLKQCFKKYITSNVNKNRINKAKQNLPKALIKLFNSVKSRKESCEKYLTIIRSLLNEKDLFEVLNGTPGIGLHNDLIKVLAINKDNK
ncbi:uncharacterized protein VNE69_05165 [Vairimorpha necatrix]|uniref:Uncharacterized protein n=1 Tax=Vairimorpha necatrix TaxID=6039 RepID=A0AAX4JC75_9MICR